MKIANRILVCLYCAIAVAPMIAMIGHLPDRGVFGAVAPVKRQKLGFGVIASEDYQKAFTVWFESALGWKGFSATTDNTLLYHLFRDTKPGGQVQIGDRGVLFSPDDLAYYNKQDAPTPEAVEKLATRIATVQSLLAAHHRALVPVIIPGKATVYRDRVSPRWTRELGQPRPSDVAIYQALTRALDAHHVRYVDARQILTAPAVNRELIWGVQGRHWTEYGACLAMREVMPIYSALTGIDEPPYDCAAKLTRLAKGRANFDLWNLLNMWRPPKRLERGPSIVHAAPPADAHKPTAMLIGTSFCWELTYDMSESHRFGQMHMDYYNTTLVEWPSSKSSTIEPHTDPWRAVFLDKELYVLDLFEVYLFADNSYVDQFLTELGDELARRTW